MPPESPSQQEGELSSSINTTRPGQPQQQNPGAPDGPPAAAPVGAQPPKEIPTPEKIMAVCGRQDALVSQFGKHLPILDPHVPTDPFALEKWRKIRDERYRIVDLCKELQAQEAHRQSKQGQAHPTLLKSTAPQAPSGTSSPGQPQAEQAPGAPAAAPPAAQPPAVDKPPRRQYTAQERQTAINGVNRFARRMGWDLPILPTLFPPEDPVLRAEWNEIRDERARIVKLLKAQKEREAAQSTNQKPAPLTTMAPKAPSATRDAASGTSSQVMRLASSSTIGKQEADAQTMAEGGELPEEPDMQKEKRKREDEKDGVSGTVSKKAKE
ncbi:uncharacterized protein J3D65DRAFT_661513 [Phyllosticta citribraziliensis]|uniref:Uncharacterized protein n=1 Tax=Phyllosticta citribraziliensis TaxID=989973 RepID=A0ABR1LCD7_9PEZI